MNQEKLFYVGNKALIRNDKSEVLILHVRRTKDEDYYDLPGGRMNKGEDVATALTREVKEETGIRDLKIEKPLGMALTSIQIPISEGEKAGLILSVYVCSGVGLSGLSAEEGVEIEWCPVVQLLDKLKRYPQELLDGINKELTLRSA